MTTNLKLRKVSDKLYEDDSATQYMKWTRGLRYLELNLFDLSAVQGVELGFKRLHCGSGDPLADVGARHGDTLLGIAMGRPVDRDWVRDEACICARGHVREGDKSLLLREFAVTIRPVSVTPGVNEDQGDFEKALAGHWGHIERESGADAESYLWLDVPAPQRAFRRIWWKLVAGGSFARASVTVLVEAFESELCRHVEVDDTGLGFERGAFQRAVLRRLVAQTPPVLPRPMVDDSDGEF